MLYPVIAGYAAEPVSNAVQHVRFTIQEQSTGKALITPPDPGTEGNKYGFEGGRVVKIGQTYHWITTEMVDAPRWVKTKIAYWTSRGAGQIYSRSDDFLVLRIFLLLWYM